MKTYLITGGAGFIGSNLVDKLVEDGHKIIVIDDFSTGKEQNLAQHKDNDNVIIERRSITDDLNDIFANNDIDGIAHLAAVARVPYSIEHPQETNNVNLNGTLNLLVAAHKHGVKRFINYGSSSEYGDAPSLPLQEGMFKEPLSPYGLQKFAADHYTRLFHYLHDMETMTIMPFNVYGPRMNPEGAYPLLIAKAIQWVLGNADDFQIYGDGEQTRDFTYVDDMVDATIKALYTDNKEAFGQSFNIGASHEQKVNDVVAKIIALSGKDLAPSHGEARIEPKRTLADVSKAKKLLGWEPQANFDEALQITFNYFNNG